MDNDHNILGALTEIETHWPILLADMAAASYAGRAPSIGSKKTSAPAARETVHDDGHTRHDDGTALPGGTERISLLADARTELFHACCLVVDERSEHYDLGTTHLDATDCIAMAVWLRPHAQWISEHLLGDEIDRDLHRIATTVKRIAEPNGRKRPVVGKCPTPECAGVLRGHIDTQDGAIDMTYDIVCDIAPEHAWPQSHWPRLGILLEDERAKADAAAAAAAGREYTDQRFPELLDDEQLLAWLAKRFALHYSATTVRVWRHRHKSTGLMKRVQTRPDSEPELKWDRLEVTKWRLGDRTVVGA